MVFNKQAPAFSKKKVAYCLEQLSSAGADNPDYRRQLLDMFVPAIIAKTAEDGSLELEYLINLSGEPYVISHESLGEILDKKVLVGRTGFEPVTT